jgi:hypothetical protein
VQSTTQTKNTNTKTRHGMYITTEDGFINEEIFQDEPETELMSHYIKTRPGGKSKRKKEKTMRHSHREINRRKYIKLNM